jgi:hypothetical protein
MKWNLKIIIVMAIKKDVIISIYFVGVIVFIYFSGFQKDF